MQFLASLFVGQPQHIILVALAFTAGYVALRYASPGVASRTRPLLAASVLWGIYAAWEWLALIRTPDANIRVDLLLIWPVLAIVSVWALVRAVR